MLMTPSKQQVMITVCLFLGCVLASTSLFAASCNEAFSSNGPVDQVYRNGNILTMDSVDSVHAAVAIIADKIVAVGDDATITCLVGDETLVHDLRGRTMVPGFIDAHSHLQDVGVFAKHAVQLYGEPTGTVASVDEIVTRLKERAATTPPGEWIIGVGYDDTTLPGNRHPTRDDLDRVSTEHKIWIYHMSFHFAVANTLALDGFNITSQTPDPTGGFIYRDPDSGEPTGILGGDAMKLGLGFDVPVADAEIVDAMQYAGEIYARQGFTTAQAGLTGPLQVKLAAQAYAAGHNMPVRLVVYPDMRATTALIEGRLVIDANIDETMFTLGATKLMADGSIQTYTGYLREPYYSPPNAQDADDLQPVGQTAQRRGYLRYAPGKMAEVFADLHSRDLQIAVHANGDAAIDQVLDDFAKAQQATPRDDPRLVIIHAQMARDDQLQRMHEMGVVPSFFMLHTFYYGDEHAATFLGPRRAARISPARSAQDLDVRFTFHTDSPVVPVDSMLLLWSAVNRITRNGMELGPEQRISPLEGLRAMTINAAHQYFQETQKGSIEPGKLADLVVLSGNPIENPAGIRDVRIDETVVGGKIVYQRSNAD